MGARGGEGPLPDSSALRRGFQEELPVPRVGITTDDFGGNPWWAALCPTLEGVHAVVVYARTSRTLARADAGNTRFSCFSASCPEEKMALQILDPKI